MCESAEITISFTRPPSHVTCQLTSKTSAAVGYCRCMETIEAAEGVMDDIAEAIPPKARSFLGGEWLGHPLHPMLTDLPIGFWTSSFVLDFLGGRRNRRASAAFVGLGVASAVPTIASGLVEYQKIEDASKRETAVIHAASNTIATFLYLWS